MSNEMFEELERTINEELEAKKLDITMQIKGFEKGGLLTNISKKRITTDEFLKIYEALSIAWNRIMKKWFKEYFEVPIKRKN